MVLVAIPAAELLGGVLSSGPGSGGVGGASYRELLGPKWVHLTLAFPHYLSSACDLEGFCDSYTWTASGAPKTQVWPSNGRKNTFEYEEGRRVQEIENGKLETITFDYIDGTKTKITDGRGLVWIVEYTSPGVPTKITNPADDSTSYTYTNGLRTGITDANGNESSLVYINSESYDNNMLSKVTNDEGETTYYRYTAANYANTDVVTGPSHVCDARSVNATDGTYCTVFTYDVHGRKITERTAGESVAEGEEWEYTDGTATYAATDTGNVPGGLLWEHRDGNISATGGEAVTQYRYDADGDLVKMTSPSGLITTWIHDDLGRVLEEWVTYTDGGSTVPQLIKEIVYDQIGRVDHITGPIIENPVTFATTGEQHQLRTTFSFDGNNQLDLKTESDTVSGSLDPTRVWGYEQDALDREIAAEAPEGLTDPSHHPVRREYDANGNVKAVTDPAGKRVETTYNDINLPETVTAIDFVDGHGNTTDRVLSWLGLPRVWLSQSISDQAAKTSDGQNKLSNSTGVNLPNPR